MSIEVIVRNRQRARRVDVRRLGVIATSLLGVEFGIRRASLGVQLVGAAAMAAMNWRWLRHEGSTDILTFDHRDDAGAVGSEGLELHGGLFISVADAIGQAREFGTTPALELVRYVVHGVLHLRGYDDIAAGSRRRMKREEDRLVRRLAARFPLRGLVGGLR